MKSRPLLWEFLDPHLDHISISETPEDGVPKNFHPSEDFPGTRNRITLHSSVNDPVSFKCTYDLGDKEFQYLVKIKVSCVFHAILFFNT